MLERDTPGSSLILYILCPCESIRFFLVTYTEPLHCSVFMKHVLTMTVRQALRTPIVTFASRGLLQGSKLPTAHEASKPLLQPYTNSDQLQQTPQIPALLLSSCPYVENSLSNSLGDHNGLPHLPGRNPHPHQNRAADAMRATKLPDHEQDDGHRRRSTGQETGRCV